VSLGPRVDVDRTGQTSVGAFVDQRLYAMSIRDEDDKKEITVKHYRIRKMDNGGWYISPKKTFNSMIELIEHCKGGCGSGCSLFAFCLESVSVFDPYRLYQSDFDMLFEGPSEELLSDSDVCIWWWSFVVSVYS
jgi:hypothetical protein